MSRKLQMSPDLSYMLGICTIDKEEPSISVLSRSYEVIERFAKIALDSLEVDPKKMMVSEEGDLKKAMFYNSMVKKLFLKSLEDRERIFKYKNEYAGSYLAGRFDTKGGIQGKSVWSGKRDMMDVIVLERLGFRVNKAGKIGNPNAYIEFIKPYSAMLEEI